MKNFILLMKNFLLLVSFLLSQSFNAQDEIITLKTPAGDLEGSILMPAKSTPVPLVLIIAGSGPTDRNGNNSEMENNSLKLLAAEFQKNGIASFRFDKRGIGQSAAMHTDESEMRPETYIEDVKSWINLLVKDKRFSRIIVAGHSEGSLFGMIASANNKNVSGFISIAGAGKPIDEILKEQFSKTPDNVKNIVYEMLDKLKKGDTLTNVPPLFYAIFRPSIQPYMRAWMKYNPQTEIKKLNVPILLTSGTTDIQVKEEDAQLLAKAQPKAQLSIIKNMNHVLKDCDTTEKETQLKTYNDPLLPLNREFAKVVVDFVNTHFLDLVNSPKGKN
ncbi:alpha/beta hydrolase [Sphingobacteriaceae bacterium]|nr:alpha/beta hydrolase [Sphingobacteriaceae bacterium]